MWGDDVYVVTTCAGVSGGLCVYVFGGVFVLTMGVSRTFCCPPARAAAQPPPSKQPSTPNPTIPPPPAHSPLCQGVIDIPLAGYTLVQLQHVLNNSLDHAPLMLRNSSAPDGGRGPDQKGSLVLMEAFWQLKGEACSLRPLHEHLTTRDNPHGNRTWSEVGVACNASLLHEEGAKWWRLRCGMVGPEGRALPRAQGNETSVWEGLTCPGGYQGPQLVAVVEKVCEGIQGVGVHRV